MLSIIDTNENSCDNGICRTVQCMARQIQQFKKIEQRLSMYADIYSSSCHNSRRVYKCHSLVQVYLCAALFDQTLPSASCSHRRAIVEAATPQTGLRKGCEYNKEIGRVLKNCQLISTKWNFGSLNNILFKSSSKQFCRSLFKNLLNYCLCLKTITCNLKKFEIIVICERSQTSNDCRPLMTL